MIFVGMLPANLPTPFYVFWQHEFNLPNASVAWLFSVYIATVLAALLIVMTIGERWSRRSPLLVALGLGVVATWRYATADSTFDLVSGRLISGIVTGILVSVGVAAAVESAPPARVPRAAAAASMMVGLAATVGPLVSGIALELLTRPQLVVFAAAAALQGAVLYLAARVVHEPRLRLSAASPDQDDQVTGSPALSSAPLPGAETRLRLAIRVAGSAYSAGFALSAVMLAIGPSLIVNELGVDRHSVVGAVLFTMGLSGLVAQLLAYVFTGSTKLVVGCLMLVSSGALLSAAVLGGWLGMLWVGTALLGGGQWLTQAGAFECVSSAAQASGRATALSRISVASYLVSGVAPLATGYVGDAFGLAAGLLMTALLVASVSAIVCVLTIRHRRLLDQ